MLVQGADSREDVYNDAAAHNVIVVGGSATTVGAAGGYLTGGGHSAWSHFYGLAVDNLLEVTIVTAKGEIKTVNEYTEPDYFYALRGGGGSAWGVMNPSILVDLFADDIRQVITSATYKTHPEPLHIQVAVAQFNTTTNIARRQVLEQVFESIVDITDSGYTGYAAIDTDTAGLIFIQPNATNATFEKTFATLNQLSALENVTGGVAPSPIVFPSWIEYSKVFLRDPNIATNVQDASRLLDANVLIRKKSELVDLIFDFPEAAPGFNFGKQPSSS